MKHCLLIAGIYLLMLLHATAISQNGKLFLLPDSAIYEKYYADALTHQLSLSKNTDTREWNGNIGGVLPLAELSCNEKKYAISLGATVFNTLVKTPGHIQVFTVDYLVEFLGDATLTEGLTGRIIWGHLSAHYSDDGIVELNQTPINYVRDYFGIHAEQNISSLNGKAYAGMFYLYHNEPDAGKQWTFQFGGDAGMLLNEDLKLYCALDCKLKSEVEYGTTQSYQIGIQYPARPKRNSIRFAYTHRRGYEERGQLFTINEQRNFIGLSLDF